MTSDITNDQARQYGSVCSDFEPFSPDPALLATLHAGGIRPPGLPRAVIERRDRGVAPRITMATRPGAATATGPLNLLDVARHLTSPPAARGDVGPMSFAGTPCQAQGDATARAFAGGPAEPLQRLSMSMPRIPASPAPVPVGPMSSVAQWLSASVRQPGSPTPLASQPDSPLTGIAARQVSSPPRSPVRPQPPARPLSPIAGAQSRPGRAAGALSSFPASPTGSPPAPAARRPLVTSAAFVRPASPSLPSSPASSRSPAVSLWRRLGDLARRLVGGTHAGAREVGENTPGVHCPEETAVLVGFQNGRRVVQHMIHANTIALPPRAADAAAPGEAAMPPRLVMAGQSPQRDDLCDRFLVHGLETGRGLFQFVSPATHRHPDASEEKTVIDQLHRRWTAAGRGGDPVVLGGRYRMIDLEPAVADAPDCRRMRLSVEDLAYPGTLSSVMLTQAGLRFDDNRLRADEIARASDLMNAHVASRSPEFDGTEDPTVVSYSGIGRNATLIVYREAVARLDEVRTEHDVDLLLGELVLTGRRDRGPGFIHSRGQLEELRIAVMRRLGPVGEQALPGPAAA